MTPHSPARNISVTLNYRPLGLVRARSHNLRLDGMYVDTSPVNLPHNSEVEVTLSYRKDDRLQVHTLPALVLGRCSSGTNIAFQHCHRDAWQALNELLHTGVVS